MRLAELLGEEVHEQTVMPPGPVGVALVAAQDPDRAEAHRRIATDDRLVVGRRVDHQPVVALVVHQLAGQRCDGVTADTASVHGGVEEDVDRGVPIVGLVFFAVLHHPAHRPLQ